MTNVATLTAKLQADTSGLKRGLSSAEREVDGFAKRSGRAMAGVAKVAAAGAVAGVAAVTAVGVKGVMAFADFEKGMNEVFTLLPGISGDAMAEMEQQVLDLSNAIGVLPEETIPAVYQALSAGVPQGNVFEFIETANKLAIGGVAELDASVGALTGVVNAYTDGSVTAAQASDMMFTTVKNGVTTIPELASQLGEVTPIAAALGIGFDEISAAMATSTKVTQNTSKSATGLKNMLAELGKSGTIAFKSFETAAGKTFPDFIAGGGNLAEALQIMDASGEASGQTMLDMFGSIEAGQEALRLASGGAAEFETQLDNMADSAGATDAAFDQMDQGLARSWDKIKTQMTTALIKVGKQLAPFVESAATWLSEKLPDAIDWLVRSFEDMKPAFDMVSHWLGEMLPRAIGLLSKAVDGLSDLWGDVWGTIEAPIAAVADTVSGAVENVSDALGAIDGSSFLESLAQFGRDAKLIWDAVWDNLGLADYEVSWDDFTSTFAMLWFAAWDGIQKTAKKLWGGITKLFGIWTGTLRTVWGRFGDNLRNIWDGVWGGIGTILSGAFDSLRGLWDTFAGFFTGDWERVWEGITTFFSGQWKILVGVAKVWWSVFSGAWGLFWDGLTWAVGSAWDAIVRIYRERWARFWEIAGGIWDDFKAAWSENWAWVTGIVGGAVDGIVSAVQLGIELIAAIFSGDWGGIVEAASNIWSAVVRTITGFVNEIIDLVNKAINAYNSLPGIPDVSGIPSVGRTSGGGTRTYPRDTSTIPTGRAFGGPVTAGTPYMVGERGPELFVPSRSGSIIPNGTPPGLTIVVEGNLFGAATVDDLAEIITTAQTGQTRRGY